MNVSSAYAFPYTLHTLTKSFYDYGSFISTESFTVYCDKDGVIFGRMSASDLDRLRADGVELTWGAPIARRVEMNPTGCT